MGRVLEIKMKKLRRVIEGFCSIIFSVVSGVMLLQGSELLLLKTVSPAGLAESQYHDLFLLLRLGGMRLHVSSSLQETIGKCNTKHIMTI